MTDLSLVAHGALRFRWGGGADLVAAGAGRDRYLAALWAADAGNYGPLIAFVRS